MFDIARRISNIKTWLTALIFANCVLWLWPLGAEGPSIEDPGLVEFQPALKLLEQSALPASRETEELSKICYAWGPYNLIEEVRALERSISGGEVKTETVSSEVSGASDYLVYIERPTDVENTRRTLEELSQELEIRSIENHQIVQGQFRDTLSVGVFSRKSGAEKQRAKVSALGYAVGIGELQHVQQVFHLIAKTSVDFVPEIAPNENCNEIAPVNQFL